MSELVNVNPFRDAALTGVVSTIAQRLEQRGLVAQGRVTVTGLNREARQSLGGILGRRLVGERLVLDLPELDTIARDRIGLNGGIVEACERALGRRLVDRPSQRQQQRQVRDEPIEQMRSAISSWPEEPAWARDWIADVARLGLLTRASQPLTVAQLATVLVGQLAVAERHTDAQGRRLARNELAARSCGDAHALDDGMVLPAVVLRGLAHSLAQPAPRSARDRRDLWQHFGVDQDQVSTTVLTLGLRFEGQDSLARRLGLAAGGSDPVHLTPRNVARLTRLRLITTAVLVCENPRVLEFAADEFGATAAVVCTMGNPATVVIDLLRLLADGGCRLDYHGDFDWPGLAIADRVSTVTGARPWRMQAADYLTAAAGSRGRLGLDGPPTGSPWDPSLREAMIEVGLAVHEEALLPELIQDWLRDTDDPDRPGSVAGRLDSGSLS
jgi:uncharacterized protein (TIGR02679 family)